MFLRGLIGLLLGGLIANAYAANPGPRISSPRHAFVKKCLQRIDELGPAQFFSSNLKWKLNCELEEFREEIRSDRKLSAMPPHVKLLLAHKLYDEFLSFLQKIGGIDQSKINPVSISYNCNTPNLIHLGSGVPPIDHPPGVVLSGEAIARSEGECLVYEGEVQRLA
jgi:hypothetical protein